MKVCRRNRQSRKLGADDGETVETLRQAEWNGRGGWSERRLLGWRGEGGIKGRKKSCRGWGRGLQPRWWMNVLEVCGISKNQDVALVQNTRGEEERLSVGTCSVCVCLYICQRVCDCSLTGGAAEQWQHVSRSGSSPANRSIQKKKKEATSTTTTTKKLNYFLIVR